MDSDEEDIEEFVKTFGEMLQENSGYPHFMTILTPQAIIPSLTISPL